jgi:hypothetical protein
MATDAARVPVLTLTARRRGVKHLVLVEGTQVWLSEALFLALCGLAECMD